MKNDLVDRFLSDTIPAGTRRVLDVGCGPGILGSEIKRLRNCEVVGITISNSEAQDASKVLDKILVRDLDEYDPREIGRFDCILCSHVLEHIRNPKKLLELLGNNLTENGILIVVLPNVVHWKQRLEFLKGKFHYTMGGPLDFTHLHFFDYQGASGLIRNAGYKISAIFFDGNFPLPGIRNLSKSLTRSIDRAAIKIAPEFFAAQFIFIAQPGM